MPFIVWENPGLAFFRVCPDYTEVHESAFYIVKRAYLCVCIDYLHF